MSNKTITMPLEEYERLLAAEGKEFEYNIDCDGIRIPVDEYAHLKDIKGAPDGEWISKDRLRRLEMKAFERPESIKLSTGIFIGFFIGFSFAGIVYAFI